MAKVAFSKLKFDKTEVVNKVTIGGEEVEVLAYAPISLKRDIIDLSIESASDDFGGISDVVAEAFFDVFTVMSYTNISFTAKQKEDTLGLYDTLQKGGVFEIVLGAIPEEELAYLHDSFERALKAERKQRNSFAGTIKALTNSLPGALNQMSESVNSVDLESPQLQTIINIAKDNGVL